VGQPQYFLFSPFPKLFSVFSPYLYNLGIAFNGICTVIFSYASAREMRLSRLAACFVTLTYSLCPYVVWLLESHYILWLLPAVVFTILRLARADTVFARAVLGAVMALFLVSMHPEFFFMGVFVGTLLSLCRVAACTSDKDDSTNDLKANFVRLVVSLAVGAI